MSEMDLKERQTGSELVFDGKILHLYHDQVALPNGDPASREYCWRSRPASWTASRRTTNPPPAGSWRRRPATMPRP